MNLKELINYGKEFLNKNNINDATIITKQLIEYVFNIKKEQIIIKENEELKQEDCKQYIKFLRKIADGKPIQYIINNQEFMKLNFYVDENVLIPQPDTEILVEEIINEYNEKECKILDLCTGSGVIAISLAKYIKQASIVASDISEKALQIAKLNAEKNLVNNKIKFLNSDMFNNIIDKDFDIIVSNPPYIKTSIINQLDIQVKNEPHIALDGGEDGLKFYKLIIENAYKFTKKNAKIFLEIGYDQKQDVIKMLEANSKYNKIFSKKDLSGNDRVIIANIGR